MSGFLACIQGVSLQNVWCTTLILSVYMTSQDTSTTKPSSITSRSCVESWLRWCLGAMKHSLWYVSALPYAVSFTFRVHLWKERGIYKTLGSRLDSLLLGFFSLRRTVTLRAVFKHVEFSSVFDYLKGCWASISNIHVRRSCNVFYVPLDRWYPYQGEVVLSKRCLMRACNI